MKILKQLDLENVIFIDIETVNQVPVLEKDSLLYQSWAYKMKYGRDPIGGDDPIAKYDAEAALYPEFAKIVCITIGKISKNSVLKIKSYVGDDEKEILTNFCAALNSLIAANNKTVLCGHAIKGFDIPWIMRRCIVNGVELPSLIDTAHLKPWETTSIDTLELWKGTAFNSASLITIAVALGLANPKDKLSGYETSKTYYNEPNGLDLIREYCEKDVLTVANIVRKCRYEEPVVPEMSDIKTQAVGVLTKVYNTKKLDTEDEKKIVKTRKKMNEKEQAIANELLDVVTAKI